MQSRIANTIGVMFDSLWNDKPPVSVAYVSNGSKLREIFVYIKLEDAQSKEEVLKVLNKNCDSFCTMIQVAFRLSVRLPNGPHL